MVKQNVAAVVYGFLPRKCHALVMKLNSYILNKKFKHFCSNEQRHFFSFTSKWSWNMSISVLSLSFVLFWEQAVIQPFNFFIYCILSTKIYHHIELQNTTVNQYKFQKGENQCISLYSSQYTIGEQISLHKPFFNISINLCKHNFIPIYWYSLLSEYYLQSLIKD